MEGWTKAVQGSTKGKKFGMTHERGANIQQTRAIVAQQQRNDT
jgi:hypothetical protein